METREENAISKFVERFINQTNQSVFLTGKAGTGKTTLLQKITKTTHKNTIVVAPTGIAALNAGGVTIHSFFQLPFGGFIPERGQPPFLSGQVKIETKATLMRHFRMNSRRKAMIRNLELLIIDEVSMLRADLLDAIDHSLRTIRKINQPYGGAQVLFIGDLLQLPPIVKREEWDVLGQYYKGAYFFNAHVVQESEPLYIELEKIYRQSDETFIRILNHLRDNHISNEDIEVLNQYVKPDFDATKTEGYITLTTHNAKADKMNADALSAISGKKYKYKAEVTGKFPEHIYPIEEQLELKIGAQVMFIKNDLSVEKQFYNGKMGKITSLSEEEVIVEFPEENRTIEVEKYEWENVKYTLNEDSGEIEEEVEGTFVHYPLKLAWAVTVHKSQGLTFEKAVLDLSQVFAPGQAYVALSRLTALDGLVLLLPIQMKGLKNEQQVVDYSENKADEKTLKQVLTLETIQFVQLQLKKAFNWEIMVSRWLAFENEHQQAGERSEMGKNQTAFLEQLNALMSTLESARKFRNQLQRLCYGGNYDVEKIHERFEAAYNYYMPLLEKVFKANLKQLIWMGQKQNTKNYFEVLEELDEAMTETILRLLRARNLIECMRFHRPITKKNIWNERVKNYKIAQVAVVQNELRAENPTLVEVEVPQRASKKKTAKKKKKSTYETTLELFRSGKEINEIAKERQMTAQTIYNHMARLIEQEKVQIEEVMEASRLKKLQEIIGKEMHEGLKPYKEQLGEAVTWDELRLYRSSLIK